MKLVFHGHDERYVVEQSLMNLFPGEKPVYEPIVPGDSSWAVISLAEPEDLCRVTVSLCRDGRTAERRYEEPLSGDDFQREGQRRHAIGACFFLAARDLTGVTPPWGMLTGVRPDKPVTWALEAGKSPEAARAYLEEHYFVTPSRAALALETGATAAKAAKRLEKRDIDVYVGIPFCPTRCAYCSFVSQSVERSFALVPPYVDALCAELTVEAGRPDTITAEKLAVLKAHGVTRVSVNPQTFEEPVLRAIGRCHTAADIDDAMDLVARCGFPHVNMDLIAGLPEDTAEGFRRSLDRCLTYGPDDITVHTLALKKGSRILTEGLRIPAAETVAEMLDYAAPALREAGYRPYYLYRQKYMSGSFENIGWCRPGGECWYNVDIMSELCSILSFGAAGSTKMVVPGTNQIQRAFNVKYPTEYIQRPEKWQANQAAFAAFYEAL